MQGLDYYMQNTYFDYDVSSYTKEDIKNFKNSIESVGFKESFPEKGGGPNDIAQQIIGWLVIHHNDIYTNIVASAVCGTIYKVSTTLYKWFKTSNHNDKTSPVVNINIHYIDNSKLQTITLNADKEYTEEEIEELVKKAEAYDVISNHFDFEKNPPYQQ